MSSTSQYRLPTNVKPVHYDVKIKTDLEKLTFEGVALIDLEIKEETSQIIFNSFSLNLGDVTLQSDGVSVKAETVEMSPKTERAIVKFGSPLPAGSKAQLGVRFGAKLTGSLLGYYYSSYKVDGVEKYYALTQFEPTAARRLFPCWDEPSFKATFGITMISRKDTVNLSNMPALAEGRFDSKSAEITDLFTNNIAEGKTEAQAALPSTSDEWKVTKFDNTPLVSTYLVAIANGPFEYLESSYESPLSGKVRPLRIYATKDLIHQAQYGLDIKAKVLPVYEKVFDIEFPLPKLDTLVVHDFDSGAMENWGLITGRTTAYLLDPKNESMTAMTRIGGTQTHEVAHQWFGNIVTMEWWDNLWLNEGFATLMGEMIVLNKIYPDWNLYADFLVEHLSEALGLDGKRSSHPIQVPLDNPDDINQIFDSLTYAKAGSVLRMLSEYVEEEKFLKGVSIYLKRHLYGNSTERDLWKGVADATGLDIPGVMDNWIYKIGYPVITVKEDEKGIVVRQDRFLETGDVKESENTTIWRVPLFLKSVDKSGNPTLDRGRLLEEREAKIELDTKQPYLVNGGYRGVYRVLYPEDRINKIAEAATQKHPIVTLEDRIGLVGDTVALAQAGLAKTSSSLSLIKSFSWEENYLGCQAMADASGSMNQVFGEDSSIRAGMKELRRSLFVPHARRLGYEKRPNDTSQDILLRTLAVRIAAAVEEPDVVKELTKRFEDYIATKDQSRIPADIIRATFANAGQSGGAKAWDDLVSVIKNPASPAMKTAAIGGLCSFKDPKLIQKTLDFTRSDVMDQDVYYFYANLSANINARRTLLDDSLANWQSIAKRYELNFVQLQNIFKYSFLRLASDEDANRVQEFFDKQDTSKFTMVLAQTLESIRANAKWAKNSKEDVRQWLKANKFAKE